MERAVADAQLLQDVKLLVTRMIGVPGYTLEAEDRNSFAITHRAFKSILKPTVVMLTAEVKARHAAYKERKMPTRFHHPVSMNRTQAIRQLTHIPPVGVPDDETELMKTRIDAIRAAAQQAAQSVSKETALRLIRDVFADQAVPQPVVGAVEAAAPAREAVPPHHHQQQHQQQQPQQNRNDWNRPDSGRGTGQAHGMDGAQTSLCLPVHLSSSVHAGPVGHSVHSIGSERKVEVPQPNGAVPVYAARYDQPQNSHSHNNNDVVMEECTPHEPRAVFSGLEMLAAVSMAESNRGHGIAISNGQV